MGEVTQSDIYALERRIDTVERLTAELGNIAETINRNLGSLNYSVGQVDSKLVRLAQDFQIMISEQRQNAAFQQAQTELVSIRQEIIQKFGKYDNVRETMIGVLQATDLALVKKTTIANVTEQIMISTPNYWLAPCLVAVSAWIGNDQDLANRAIAEAVKRDEEKTALVMALICRRNNRVSTCYEWLSLYFANQDSANFSEGTFTYIDAYVNGVFGKDEKHICDDYINKWMNEIKESGQAFEDEQTGTWKAYCERFKRDTSQNYPEMKSNVSEYRRIDDYIGRIDSVDSIHEKFSKIIDWDVNTDVLKKKIDHQLINLVSRFDDAELDLRNEERYWRKVKEYRGNEERARDEIEEEKRLRKENTLNLVQQMTKVIVSENEAPSEKKTAVAFLGNYIKKGYTAYIEEKRSGFPEEITLNIDEWSGKSSDGSNTPQLMKDYEGFMNNRRKAELDATVNNNEKIQMYGAIAAGVAGLILLFVAWPLGLAALGAGGWLAYKMFKTKKDTDALRTQINQNYDASITAGKGRIAATMTEWDSARNKVREFNEEPLKDIIA
ncbi:MAG: hypothetical protein J6Y89_06630 [Lachnospiraceae bacterium]|nr:hypothetical protein [Lachnospiraceae bacterium]